MTTPSPVILLLVTLALWNLTSAKPCPPLQQHGTERAPQPNNRSDEQANLARRLREYLPQLKEKTTVPPRLTTYFPRLGKADDLYVNVLSADSTGYEIVLGFTPDCEGQNVCGYGRLIGTTRSFNEIKEIEGQKWVPVTLAGRIKARYYDTQCAAYCSYSVVAWSEGKWHYLVEFRAERKSLVIRAANSALAR